MPTFIIAFVSFFGLIVIHELSHFIAAKKIGVKVEEFGIGYPPKVFGKKIGDTIYSLNLLPFGAFVRIEGEEGSEGINSGFKGKTFWQKFIVIAAGVVSFWVIAWVLFSLVMALGSPEIIEDDTKGNFTDPKIQVYDIAVDSPAEKAGFKIGDSILNVGVLQNRYKVDYVKDFQNLINENRGKEITLTLKRGQEVFDVVLTPRISPPEKEGPLGIGLVRTAITNYPWHIAFLRGMETTYSLTIRTVQGWGQAISNIFQDRPTGVRLMGPVGIFDLFLQATRMGVGYFMNFIGVIAVNIALVNIIPIPVTDGGKIMFLLVEKIRKKPFTRKFEERINMISFVLLILLSILITIKDIQRIF